MTQYDIAKEIIDMMARLNERDRIAFLLMHYEFIVKRKLNAGGGACCF